MGADQDARPKRDTESPSRPAPPTGYLPGLHARWLADPAAPAHRTLPGSLLFADVSGFTKLSERLAKRGPVGSEELTEVVNAVFDGMLAVIDGHGGEVLKFGGDALLACFTGNDHERRAAAAARNIQSGVRPFRRLRTDAGSVSLRVSIAVASGDVLLVLAGSTHRELLVCGPVARTVCALEGAAEAGEVLVDAPTAVALGPDHLGAAKGDGFLLASVPVGLLPAPETVVASVVDEGEAAIGGLPAHLHDRVPGDGEHRPVCVAFVQVRGTDDLLAAEGPAALAAALHHVVGGVMDACAAHGITFLGSDVDAGACKLLLVAGAPTAILQEEDRLLHALRSAVATDRTGGLRVRAGVNRGRVFLGDVGSERRRTWTFMGDPVNLAARVMGKAPDGAVLATRALLERTTDAFARTPIEPFTVKGKTGLQHAELVGAARGRRARREGAGAPLVGREAELGVLRDALTVARAGGGRAVELVGEAGIGKSRLVAAVRREATGFREVVVEGGPYGVLSPYLAMRTPLRALVGAAPEAGDDEVALRLRDAARAIDADLTAWLPLLGLPLGLELPPTDETAQLSSKFSRAQLHRVVTTLLDGVLGDIPTLLLVEDAHWLDEASSDLLGHLIGALRRSGRLVLLTRRPADTGLRLPGGDVTRSLALAPLDATAARALLTAGDGGLDAPAPLAPDVVAALVERSGGNPLFLRELLDAARAGSSLEELPDTVEGLISARIDTLGHEDRAVLRQAAVLGVHVPTALLEQLLDGGPPAARAALRRLGDFLVEDSPGRLSFRHALLRDTAYAALPYRRRRVLHARAAALIRRGDGRAVDEESELLAVHHHAAGQWPETWQAGRRAGERALRRAAPVEAVGFFGRAIDAARHLPGLSADEHAAAAERLATAAELASRWDQAADALALARRLMVDDPLALAELCRKEGRLRERRDAYVQALRWYTRGEQVLDRARLRGSQPQTTLARLTAAKGATRLRQGRYTASIPLLEAAIPGLEAADDLPGLAHAYYLLEWAYAHLGDPRAAAVREKPLPIYEQLGDHQGRARVLNNLGVTAYYESRWREAVEHYEASLKANQLVGDVTQVAILRHNIAEVRLDQGRLAEAEQLFADALETLLATDQHVSAETARTNLARARARQGDLEGARRMLDRARTALGSLDAHDIRLEADAREAERRILAGDHAGALALCGTIRVEARRLGASPWLLSQVQRTAAWCKAQAGDEDAAVVRLREALDLAREADAAYEQALALQALVRTGAEGEWALEEADTTFERLGVVAIPYVPLPS